MERAERFLVEAMEKAAVQTIKMQDGLTFFLQPKFYFSTRAELRPQIEDWLREQGEALKDYIEEPRVSHAQLATLLKKKLEEEGSIAIPDFFDLNTPSGIAVRGWKSRSK